ncbi:rna helicase [Holotrichia oblita]|uniref:Rna helicase n=1 Tax=Holotrichia oblita TaxID=644536 RepID=A0ACB9TI73_HOLOL|nr:rna helicase [Holotrichia oblita]
MDAYDIFKKITKGAKFKLKREPLVKPLESDVTIKSEPIDNSLTCPVVSSISSMEQEKDDFVLLNSLKDGQITRKKRKKDQNLSSIDDEIKQKRMREEKANQYRNENSISVVGRHVPEPIKSFKELSFVDADLLVNITKCGYTEPTPIQKQAIPAMLEKRQILACAPTGSGKTVAFLLPLLQHLEEPKSNGFRALIICPTRELAKQIQQECVRLCDGKKFKIHIISKINKAMSQYGPKSNGKYDILVTTPNRLCFLLNQDPPAISLKCVEWLIIDEADKLFEEGEKFS